MRIRFLEFVYEYDTNTGAKYDQPYFEAVLKRCCAISASFLGGERVELDYIRHMLDFGTYPYDENYDFAMIFLITHHCINTIMESCFFI